MRGSGGLTTAGRSAVLGLGPDVVASPCSLDFRVVGLLTGVRGSPRGIEAPVVLRACVSVGRLAASAPAVARGEIGVGATDPKCPFRVGAFSLVEA